ncbi:hypothetical protein HELRODRAFT_161331 [Helobdella robusta]|uniref:Glycerol-3-phosphate dehydrogenase n=1 Tax=Helobdella robusta TaxID=6412 RepID=T1ERC7_HELRO|nr:hypothetical protein HELRODRAFT_161331 [Helobdella robusta]ESO02099.1 hypothetical protein HELRODRAFT_161331 [Helobdella robusta]
MSFRRAIKKFVIITSAVAGGTAFSFWYISRSPANLYKSEELLHATDSYLKISQGPLLTRGEQLKDLQKNEYDILIIGGGATGCGIALDATTRGLKTALVEKFDFSSGTSSRSTKLIHGGVRYLQKAIMNLDVEQYRMVKEALTERGNLLNIAPHLAQPLPIMLPVYK